MQRIITSAIISIGCALAAQASPEIPEEELDSIADALLEEVVVVAKLPTATENAMLRQQQQSYAVQTAISAQMIKRAQDRDASEAIRRVPGVSIIDDSYVMVRGLSQRYNNVWINAGGVPSSEADSRAFSFDIIPANQIDNLTIVKSPSAEYPSDFTGGFILVRTKQTVASASGSINATIGWNDNATLHTMLLGRGQHRGLGSLVSYSGWEDEIDPIASGLDNDWRLKRFSALPDMKASASYANSWRRDDGATIGLISALNFGNGYKRYVDMENSLLGPYDVSNDKVVYLRRAHDNQYTRDVRLGAMLNLSYAKGAVASYEWNNIFNLLIKDRYTERRGINAQPDSIHNNEYFHSSRATYNTQLNSHYLWTNDQLDWGAAYSMANRNMPDRRMIERNDRTDGTMGIYRISREYTRLDEHIGSLKLDYSHRWQPGVAELMLKTGGYGEYRTRRYRARELQYGWQPENRLEAGWQFDPDVAQNVLVDANYGPDGLYAYEEVNWLNSYHAHQSQGAAYASLDLEWGAWRLRGGLRYENVRQTLGLNTRQYEESRQNTTYTYSDFFPSLSVIYLLPRNQQLRAAYGRSTNRPEFRELAPSTFYDFELGSSVMGNYDLKAAYIQNFDLRWEWYPTTGEMVSVALFYKHFTNPIEWTYTVAGGTDLVYSYINARGANNYGVEVDLRKTLNFIGLPAFSLSFNGSWIHSRVTFYEGTNNIDRPMQGQSPYIINAGLFYNPRQGGWSGSLMYNVIGKRIKGVGNKYGTGTDGSARTIPNSYEMPRNVIDLSVTKKWGRWEGRLSVRDLLAQPYTFRQYEEVTIGDKTVSISHINRRYKPGRTVYLTIGYSF